ncbi:hypothetical protein [Streptomyces sp. NL15-2K]|uniref:hypothetical protein n=1 Tax=Streptomyces sp. NL15-2K TaxID=376149 RepID=UPI000F573B05|nr:MULTISPECIES: hypothetical protein [Actinomycetes]WKX11279.1 hypothetical protein Q4V64_28690 [Kutzneria buriramensis]
MAPPHTASAPRTAGSGARLLLAVGEGPAVPETWAVEVVLSGPATVGVGAVGLPGVTPGVEVVLSDPATVGVGAVGPAAALCVLVGGLDDC